MGWRNCLPLGSVRDANYIGVVAKCKVFLYKRFTIIFVDLWWFWEFNDVMTKAKWMRLNSSLPNLNVLMMGDNEMGFVYKPADSKSDKNAWRVHLGIGDAARFIGHQWSKSDAQRFLEAHVFGNVRGISSGISS